MSDATARIPEGSVIITPTEMYSEMRSIGQKIDHLSAVMDPAVTELRGDISELKAEQSTQRERLSSLDRRVYAIGAVAAALGGVAGYVLPLITR